MPLLIVGAALAVLICVVLASLLTRLWRRDDKRALFAVAALILLGLFYFLPKMIEGGINAYRVGSEIRKQQGR